MQQYLTKRLLLFIPTIILVSLIAFLMLRIVPGDPAVARLAGPFGDAQYTQEQLKELQQKLGTDRNIVVQYVEWFFGMFRGDLGDSLFDDRPVTESMKRRLPVSAELAVGAIIFSTILAIPLGVMSAVRQNTWVDYLGRVVAITGVTIPLFVFAILLLFVLVKGFNYSPVVLVYPELWEEPWANIKKMFIPILTLSVTRIGYMARITRSGMLEVLREDYVRTARAKGLMEQAVVYRHALRNALLPVLTLAAFQFAVLLGGTVIVEQIFQLPGIGRLLIESIFNRDYTMVQGIVMTMVGAILVINLIVDLLYGVLDPRIRFQ